VDLKVSQVLFRPCREAVAVAVGRIKGEIVKDPNNQVRIDFVNAMWKVNGCAVNLCTAPECGHIEIERMFSQLGIEHGASGEVGRPYRFRKSLESKTDADQLDALLMVNVFISDGRLMSGDIFEGMLEVPLQIGDLLHVEGWSTRLREAASASPWIREATNREFILEVVKLAFPDWFLTMLSTNHNDANVLTGEDALGDMRERFSSGMMVAPLVPVGLIDGLNVWKGDWGWNSASPWKFEACYMLDSFMFEVSDSDPEASNLGARIPYEYVRQDRDDYFMCAQRGHGLNSYGLGIVAQFGGLFISQQTGYGGVYMQSPEKDVTRHMKAYNRLIAPLEKFNSSVSTGVLFSDYRSYAAIFTTERRAFLKTTSDKDLESRRWHLPSGWGIAADLEISDYIGFKTRLQEMIEANYSPQLTASAQYLLKVVRFRG